MESKIGEYIYTALTHSESRKHRPPLVNVLEQLGCSLAARDNVDVYITGSLAECTEAGSDIDIMFIARDFEIGGESSPLICETSVSSSAYVVLKVTDPSNLTDLLKTCTTGRGGNVYISSTSFRENMTQKLLQNQREDLELRTHGPAIERPPESDIHTISDLIYGIKLNSLPTNVFTHVDLHDVDIFVVPTGCCGSSNQDIEWRLSFSMSEKMLIQSLSSMKLCCYRILKYVKNSVWPSPPGSDNKPAVSSYIMKTLILWAAHNISDSEWTPQNLFGILHKILQNMLSCYRNAMLPLVFYSGLQSHCKFEFR